MVVYKPHLYARGSSVGKYSGYSSPCFVILEYVVLHIDGMACIAQVVLQGFEFVFTVGENRYRIITVELRTRKRPAQNICCTDSAVSPALLGSANVRPSRRRSLRLLRREIMRVFLMLRPKKM